MPEQFERMALLAAKKRTAAGAAARTLLGTPAEQRDYDRRLAEAKARDLRHFRKMVLGDPNAPVVTPPREPLLRRIWSRVRQSISRRQSTRRAPQATAAGGDDPDPADVTKTLQSVMSPRADVSAGGFLLNAGKDEGAGSAKTQRPQRDRSDAATPPAKI